MYGWFRNGKQCMCIHYLGDIRLTPFYDADECLAKMERYIEEINKGWVPHTNIIVVWVCACADPSILLCRGPCSKYSITGPDGQPITGKLEFKLCEEVFKVSIKNISVSHSNYWRLITLGRCLWYRIRWIQVFEFGNCRGTGPEQPILWLWESASRGWPAEGGLWHTGHTLTPPFLVN